MESLRALAGRFRSKISERLETIDLVRLGLVSATIVVMLGLIAVPVLDQLRAPDPASVESEVAGAEPENLSRLPRPRPDAPETTGSIEPASPAPAADLSAVARGAKAEAAPAR